MITFRGQPVSEGVAVGELYLPDVPGVLGVLGVSGVPGGEPAQSPGSPGSPGSAGSAADIVREAFARVAGERAELAGRLRAAGRDRDADIVRIGALIAADPALTGPALDAAAAGTPAVAAVRDAAEVQASILDALPDPDLAQRASDVRQVAEAVIAHLPGLATPEPPARPFILVRREVDPAHLIRLADRGDDQAGPGHRLVGAVSVGGGASSHAAIIARGLGLPMLAGADPALLTATAGRQAILDALTGELVVDPPPDALACASAASTAPTSRRSAAGNVRTIDGEQVTVMCNVASAAETRLGLAGGAAGVGVLRTEIPFTQASSWPSREEHLAQLYPILRLLEGHRAVVRLLDFSGDKIPPFPGAEGLPALLAAPGALRDQLDAILRAGAGTDLAVMIPMVRALDEISHVRAELAAAAKRAGADSPPLGIMVEVAATAAAADRFAPHVDFFSIGTNDLTADVLRRDRAALLPSAASERPVLTLIAHVIAAAKQAGIGVSVCGDAAADPVVLPLLIGAGVRTVSVGAARVPLVADAIAGIDAAQSSARLAQIAAAEPSATETDRCTG